MKRICIHTKDIQWLTGKSERQSRKVINDIKLKLNKQKNHLVTVKEFCDYTGLDYETVSTQIK